LEDLFFAVGEEIVGIFEALALHLAHIVFQQSLRNGRAEEEFLVGDGPDSLEQIGLGAVLEEIALGTGGEGADQKGLVAVHAQHNDADIGIALDDLGRRVDAIELGHSNVHDDHVGRELFGEADGFAAIGGFADDIDSGVGLEQEPKTFANYSVIIGNEYFGGGRHAAASEGFIGRLEDFLEPQLCPTIGPVLL
jgi:hypothetical protein